MYVAFLIVSPIDRGSSLSRYVKKAIGAVRDSGLDYQVTPMGTVIQSEDLQSIFDCSRAAVEAVRKEGSERISLSLKVDIRYDKDIDFNSKLEAVR
jgi:uncharacterized protein (TIGR00106 family)